MTVADLIKELQKMDQDAEVWGNSSAGGECGPIDINPFYNETVIEFSGGSGNYVYTYWVSKRDSAGLSGINSKDVVMIDVI